MTLAPERTQTRPADDTRASTENPNMPAPSMNSRLSVTSAEPRPQRPEFKKSGSPNPASHLSPEQIEEIGRELDLIRAEVMDSRGAADAAYIRKVIKAQRYLEMGSRAALLFSGVKYKGIRPMWWLGTAGLSVSKILENMELGHNIMHGQWDWMRDPKIHSTAWEWDHASPAEQWKHSHNQIHHTFTNVLGRDNDLGYGILRVDQDQRWSLFYLFQPVWHVANALLFEYSIAAYDLELGGYLAKKKRMSEEEKAEFHANAKADGRQDQDADGQGLRRPPRDGGGDVHRLRAAHSQRQHRREPRPQRLVQHDHHLRPLPARHRDLREGVDRGRDAR